MFVQSHSIVPIPATLLNIFTADNRRRRFLILTHTNAHTQLTSIQSSIKPADVSDVVADTLRLLEWDRLVDSVAAFAGTPLGRAASKEQLWSIDVSFEDSNCLLSETAAAVEMIKHGLGGLDFAGLDLILVKSATDCAARGFPVNGFEALAVASLSLFAETLQINVKAAIKEDIDCYNRFMPLSEVIMDFVIFRELVKCVQQVIQEDGMIKDSASPELKHSRDQVKALEKKLYQLMDKIARSNKSEASSMEVCVINGRWCIKTSSNQSAEIDGLLLSSAADGGVLEPVVAVQLNDKLQELRSMVAKAEEDVLSRLTEKVVVEVDGILLLLQKIIWVDAVVARAKYSMSYGGNYPELFFPINSSGTPTKEDASIGDGEAGTVPTSSPPRKDWKLYMPKAYHPLLLQQHRDDLSKAKKNIASFATDIRRKRLQGKLESGEESILASMKLKAAEMERNHPVPIDFMVSMRTSVLVVTGPNTGGKTISLKTVGLASLMAKVGLYVLASEPVKIPWFDAIFADIGDEQSLTQSLSTFSGHLKQISAIRSHSSDRSLVLLDEVGAGTNPLEGAALGMALLESFAENGSFLTIATTHHGELKTLKYSNPAFENACVEFDEESLRPTYKILWGIPGRSNAISIAKRLGLPSALLDSALKLYGAPSAEINEVIVDMERHKHDYQCDLQEADHYLRLSKKLREDLLIARRYVIAHNLSLKSKKVKSISEMASIARSNLRNKFQQFRESTLASKGTTKGTHIENRTSSKRIDPSPKAESPNQEMRYSNTHMASRDKFKTPAVGEMVFVPTLRKQALVLEVEKSKGQIVVQASNMKLRLNVNDIRNPQTRAK